VALFSNDMTGILLTLVILLGPSCCSTIAQNTNINSTSAIDILVREIHDAATWGAPATNGIQLGVAMFLGDSNKAIKFGTSAYLYDSNVCAGLIYPPNGYRLELSLRDADGHGVEKTGNGKAISKPMSILEKTQLLAKADLNAENKLNFLEPRGICRYESFYLLDCFKVVKPGTNTLTVGATIFKLKPNGWGAFEIVLPPASIQVPITEADLDRYRASKRDAQ